MKKQNKTFYKLFKEDLLDKDGLKVSLIKNTHFLFDKNKMFLSCLRDRK